MKKIKVLIISRAERFRTICIGTICPTRPTNSPQKNNEKVAKHKTNYLHNLNLNLKSDSKICARKTTTPIIYM